GRERRQRGGAVVRLDAPGQQHHAGHADGAERGRATGHVPGRRTIACASATSTFTVELAATGTRSSANPSLVVPRAAPDDVARSGQPAGEIADERPKTIAQSVVCDAAGRDVSYGVPPVAQSPFWLARAAPDVVSDIPVAFASICAQFGPDSAR